MATEDHRPSLDHIADWNKWRRESPGIQLDFHGAHFSGRYLSGASLDGANFSEAFLSEANLNRATLFKADLHEAELRGAHLRGTDLRQADLHGADLTGADLTWAHLNGADLRGAHLRGADLSEAYLTGADLTGADLSRAICVQTNFSSATLTRCTVYGISAWDVNLEGTMQADLGVTSPDEQNSLRVDNLEVAQFLYLLLHNEKMRTVLDTITSKVVLILGRFSDERKPILDALREALRRHPNGYIPVLFDFEPQADKPVMETVKMLANLARFVIADLTDPHMVRAELTAIVPHVPTVPIQPIIEGNASLPTEYESWALYRSFLPVYRYVDLSHLLASLDESVITPVEAHVQARRL